MERNRIVSRRPARAGTSRKSQAGEADRRPGRPRSDEAHGAILSAAISLLREVGYDALAIDAIAARAGVGKATVYRRWKAKETLVAEAIERIIRAIPIPDTGGTQGDLMVLMRGALELYQEPQSAALLSGLAAAMARSPRIAEAARAGFLATRRDAVRRVLERGIQRGELRDGIDLELAIDLLHGPLLYRLVVTGGRIDERIARDVIDVVLRGLAPKE